MRRDPSARPQVNEFLSHVGTKGESGDLDEKGDGPCKKEEVVDEGRVSPERLVGRFHSGVSNGVEGR